MSNLKPLMIASLGLMALGASEVANAAPEGPGIDAIDLFRKGRPNRPSVQNRFFIKKNRFEGSLGMGYVPNNPFAQRFVGGMSFGYHFNELFAAQALITYSPDLGEGDLKGLTSTLVWISNDPNFQQPLDKVTLAFSANVVMAPLYGKINLLGERVLNFDLYFVAGLGMNSKTNYYAVPDPDFPGEIALERPDGAVEVKVGPNLGMGFNFFLNQSVALKLDGRMNFYVDNAPQYDQDVASVGSRLYNNFVVSGGVSVFFPKMQERIYDF
jgi:outer membrane beta-barrel protein